MIAWGLRSRNERRGLTAKGYKEFWGDDENIANHDFDDGNLLYNLLKPIDLYTEKC